MAITKKLVIRFASGEPDRIENSREPCQFEPCQFIEPHRNQSGPPIIPLTVELTNLDSPMENISLGTIILFSGTELRCGSINWQAQLAGLLEF